MKRFHCIVVSTGYAPIQWRGYRGGRLDESRTLQQLFRAKMPCLLHYQWEFFVIGTCDLAVNLMRRLLRRCGLAVRRYPNPYDEPCVRQIMLRYLRIDEVLDVGANVGQFAEELYDHGYKGQVISLEPISDFYNVLESKCRARGNIVWRCQKLALGETDGKSIIHVARTMSSILEKSSIASQAVAFSAERDETVDIAKLDTICHKLLSDSERVWMKLDVQGYEMHVLRGAVKSLQEIIAVEMELSLWPFYKGQPDYRDLISYMESNGFELASLAPNGRNSQTGRLIELNGIFTRTGELPV